MSSRTTRWESFPSRFVAPRHIDLWRTPGDPTRPLPTLYCHDGQNLFEPLSSIGGVAWGLDEALTALTEAGAIDGAQVVGIWNTPNRLREYLPQKAVAFADAAGVVSDAYVRFLVDELKPRVESRCAVDPERSFLLGSSMGGLISLYALTERPDAFVGAACLSTHWPAGGDALVDYFGDALPAPGRHRLYFDHGSAGLDAEYGPYQARMDAHLAAAGYTPERDWRTRRFDGADHNEAAWRARVALPLEFLLGAPPRMP